MDYLEQGDKPCKRRMGQKSSERQRTNTTLVFAPLVCVQLPAGSDDRCCGVDVSGRRRLGLSRTNEARTYRDHKAHGIHRRTNRFAEFGLA